MDVERDETSCVQCADDGLVKAGGVNDASFTIDFPRRSQKSSSKTKSPQLDATSTSVTFFGFAAAIGRAILGAIASKVGGLQ